jgi:HlyD family secretion protein
MKYNPICLIPFLVILGCSNRNNDSDAYGNFESTEVTISSEGNGKLIFLKIEEGDELNPGIQAGLVDTLQLYYKKEQLAARISSFYSKTIDIPSQINVLIERKKILEKERERINNLLAANAATQKQLDDLNGEIEVTERELKASQERLEISNKGLLSEIKPIRAQIDEINDQIRRCKINNPIKGTVLAKYAEENEITAFGKPLYKIADLTTVYLRAYISGEQLDDIKIGQKVTVLIDKDNKSFHNYNGIITWISEKSEFTPKIVQTKKERVNLVYAIKIKVANDGRIKIGMPGEVKFNGTE